VLADAQRLVAVGCFCIGTNQVDLDAAANAGIPVFNAPYSNTRSWPSWCWPRPSCCCAASRRRTPCHRGGWSKSPPTAFEVRGKTLGIVGYGHIGTQVGVLAEALGMQVIFYDIETKLPLGNARASAAPGRAAGAATSSPCTCRRRRPPSG
jgi:D-3-phosphoglycerate dehydrogenase